MLGVKVGEKFKIKGHEGLTYRFNDDELIFNDDNNAKIYIASSVTFTGLLNGKVEIIKLPWKPKEGETYWTFILYDSDIRLGIEPHEWLDDIFDFALFKAGWIYRSYEEAEAALPAVAKAMNIEYKI